MAGISTDNPGNSHAADHPRIPGAAGATGTWSKLNGFERVLEGFQTVVGTPEPEPEPEPDPISPGSSPKKNDEPGGSYPAEFELVWQEYPKRAGANPKKSAFKAWNARRIVTTTVSGFTADVLRAEMIVEGMGYKVMNAEMIHNSCVEADK